MKSTARFTWRGAWLALLVSVLLALLAVPFFAEVAPTAAQDPTPTPNDPVWLAFSEARSALEEKFDTDLQLVRNYEWAQTEWTSPEGIEDCLNPENRSGEQLWFGWRFVITSLLGNQYEGRSSFDRSVIIACDNVTAPAQVAAAPADPGAADPNLPAPVAGSGAVGGFELGGHVFDFNAGTVSAMQRSGMTWVKKQLRYNLGDDPGVAAGLIQAAQSNGFRILLGIVGNPAQMGDYGSYVQSYASFVGGVAALGADAIEVWNEPNIAREWPAGQINGGTYTQMLAAAFNAIKSSNPNTIVISGAPAPTGFFGAAGCTAQGCNDDVFMQQMAAAGAGQYMDCVGLHYNEGIIAPNQNSGDPRGSYPTYYFDQMLNRGFAPFGGTPVCWTELGYLSGEGFDMPIPAGFAWANNTTQTQKAAWLAEAVSRSAQSGRVRLMIIWNVDFPFFTATDPMGGYAMIEPGGACRACDTVGAVMGG
ncbi:MAG: hypothetical protein GYB67_02295 [Chloroflexi bacterium]|nr:hypothetical protein [Chloroflexota bacterium]